MATNSQGRLEPRMLQLLCILVLNRGRVVTRDFFISEVWNNYGGADEGLSQGISFLRKSLMDSDKKIIATIPKQGYVLNCMVDFLEPDVPDHTVTNGSGSVVNFKSNWTLAALVIAGIAIILAVFSLNNKGDNTRVVAASVQQIQLKPTENRASFVSYPQIKEHDLDNESNSIRTIDKKGNQYLLEIYGDERPRFYINDKLIKDTRPYTNLIDHLEKMLWDKGRKKSR